MLALGSTLRMGNGQTAPSASWQCGSCCVTDEDSNVVAIESEAPFSPQRARSEHSDTATPHSSKGSEGSDRDRMQDSVLKFAQRAQKGVEIEIFEKGAVGDDAAGDAVRPLSGDLLPATYQLDRALRRVTVRSKQGAVKWKFLLANASCSSWNDAPTNGGANEKASLTPVVQDLKRAVCIELETLDGVDEYNFVFSDHGRAEEFVTCITVLKMYGQLGSPKPPGTPKGDSDQAPLAPR